MGRKCNPYASPTVKLIGRIIDDAGLSWEAKAGSSHIKIFIDNRMATVVSFGGNKMADREEFNLRATLKRAIADAKQRQALSRGQPCCAGTDDRSRTEGRQRRL